MALARHPVGDVTWVAAVAGGRPDPILLQALAAGLLDRGVGRVIRVAAVDGVDQLLTDGVVGALALISLGVW